MHKYRFVKKLKILVKILKFITDGGKVPSTFLKDARELIILKIGKRSERSIYPVFHLKIVPQGTKRVIMKRFLKMSANESEGIKDYQHFAIMN